MNAGPRMSRAPALGLLLFSLRAMSVLGQGQGHALDDRFEEESAYWPFREPSSSDEKVRSASALTNLLETNSKLEPEFNRTLSLHIIGHVKLGEPMDEMDGTEGVLRFDSHLLVRNHQRVTLWSEHGAILDGGNLGRIFRVCARATSFHPPLPAPCRIDAMLCVCAGGWRCATSADQHQRDGRQSNLRGRLWARAGRR